MNITNRQQMLGLYAIIAVVLLAGDRLVFTPLTKSWKARTERLAELKKSVRQGSQLLERQNSIRTRWDHMRTNTLSGEVPEAEKQVLKAFERWSQDSRVGISSIRPQWKTADDDHVTLECRVDAFGNLPALTRFLFDIEKDPLALKVEAVEIRTRDEGGEQLTLGLQVSGLLINPPGP